MEGRLLQSVNEYAEDKKLQNKIKELETKLKALERVVDAVHKYTLSKEYKDREIIDRRLFILEDAIVKFLKVEEKS